MGPSKQLHLMLGIVLAFSAGGFSVEIKRKPESSEVSIEKGKWAEVKLQLVNVEDSIVVTNISLNGRCKQDDISRLSNEHLRIWCNQLNTTGSKFICGTFTILLRGDEVDVNNTRIGLCVHRLNPNLTTSVTHQFTIKVTDVSSSNGSTINTNKDLRRCMDVIVPALAASMGCAITLSMFLNILLTMCLCNRPSTDACDRSRRSNHKTYPQEIPATIVIPSSKTQPGDRKEN